MTTILSGSDGRIKRDGAFRGKLALFKGRDQGETYSSIERKSISRTYFSIAAYFLLRSPHDSQHLRYQTKKIMNHNVATGLCVALIAFYLVCIDAEVSPYFLMSYNTRLIGQYSVRQAVKVL